MAIDEVRIDGLDDLMRQLDELPIKVERNVAGGAVRAGAMVLRDAARANVHSVMGALRKSIRVSTRARSGEVRASIYAGGKATKTGQDFYALSVEFGTHPHDIKPKNRKSLFFAGLMREVVRHPGARKKPFMRPALDAHWRDAVERAAEYIRDRLPKEVEKLGR